MASLSSQITTLTNTNVFIANSYLDDKITNDWSAITESQITTLFDDFYANTKIKQTISYMAKLLITNRGRKIEKILRNYTNKKKLIEKWVNNYVEIFI